MAETTPTRVDEDLLACAQRVGLRMKRSVAQQIAYWARLGREIDAAADVSHQDIAEVLARRRSYDDLNSKEQAIVRVDWEERIAARRQSIDLAERFRRDGRAYVELGDDGRWKRVTS